MTEQNLFYHDLLKNGRNCQAAMVSRAPFRDEPFEIMNQDAQSSVRTAESAN